ncbi:ABC transporter permease [Siminovitchia sp. FSL H7-0308]|uniref:YhgE/Pip domain-containing protein n=1 Tax=Siminovitchia sp. FSL H7-0308 TaxID=2921432 RepID=UPI0030ED726C
MKELKAFFKVRTTYMGIMAAIMFQLIFFSVWLTAYKGVQDRTDHLSIGVVNEDQKNEMDIAKELGQTLPFQVKQYSTFKKASREMDERKIEMIIHIPANFTSSLKSEERPSIYYWINQANATSSKTMMEQVAKQVNHELNEKVFLLQKAAGTAMFEQKLQEMPLEQPVAQAIEEAVQSAIASIDPEPVEGVIKKTNAAEEFSANLVPLMVIISSFAGAMVMIMQIHEAATTIRSAYSKWRLFFARQLINVGVAFLLPFLTISLMKLFAVTSQEPFGMIYLFQAIMFLSFLTFAQVFVFLFGNLGMVFNILALSLQLVTSGVLVSRELLAKGYHALAPFLPATYGADGYYAIVFGGNSSILKENIWYLLLITGITFLLAIGAVAVWRDSSKEKVRPQGTSVVK